MSEAFGAIWLPGLSWHPPTDLARITVTASGFGAQLEDFDVVDERSYDCAGHRSLLIRLARWAGGATSPD